jgi:hypothetical protein
MAYMAPEQITGRHPVSRKTDLYALGCVLFEMLTGRTPFQSETQPELLFKHVEEDPPSAREFNIDVPLWLDQLIAELMEKEPDDRPFDALAVQVKLEEVKQKVAEQESIVRQTVAGGGSAATMKDRDPTLEKALGIRKKKRKRKVDHSAFYERAWFLGLCLLAVVGLIAWGFWPEAEQKIFDRIQPIMASADPDDWPDAKADLEKLLGRYPDGPHADQARRWLDDIEIQRIANYIQTRFGKLGHAPETEAQRLYVEAREYEKFGDRLAALDVYENLEHILAGDDDLEHRAFLVLAKREAERIKATVGDDADRSVFIRNQIAAGDDLYKSGKRLEAREKWRSVVKLYGGKREFEVQVKMAEARIDNPDAALQDVPPAPVP